MEEERRLCYVAMTRAEKRLYVTWARYRRRFGGGQPEVCIPSRFLNEVPVNLRDWLPTVSCHHLAGERLEQWQRLYDQAQRCLLLSNYQDGIMTMRQAIALESEHAESYFWLGRMLESSTGKYSTELAKMMGTTPPVLTFIGM